MKSSYDHIRTYSLVVTEAIWTTSAAAIEALLGQPSIHIYLKVKKTRYSFQNATINSPPAYIIRGISLLESIKIHGTLGMPSDIMSITTN